MIQLGKMQNLKVLRVTSIGAYLGEERDPLAIFSRTASSNSSSITDKTDVLLPKNEIKSALNIDDTIRAFVYLDSEDRPIATLKNPPLTIGTIARLTVKDVNKVGAFLDWGLPKDLFLPFKEQTVKVMPGDSVLVTLYIDKSKRLCATTKIYKYLRLDSDYQKSEWVDGTVYELSETIGAFVAVDNMFSALIPKKELIRDVSMGEQIHARISRVLEDGKLELSLREPGYLQLGPDCDVIYSKLKDAKDGFLPYHDKSDSEEIKSAFNMSKNSFKRAIGHLMKNHFIEIRDDGIKLITK